MKNFKTKISLVLCCALFFVFSCKNNESEIVENLQTSAKLISELKFTYTVDGEFANLQKFIDAERKAGNKVDPIKKAGENYKLYAKKYGFDESMASKARLSGNIQDFINNFQSDLSKLPDNESSKALGKEVLNKYRNLSNASNYTAEEKKVINEVFNQYDSVINNIENLLGNPNGKVQFCWAKFWCVAGSALGNGLVFGIASGNGAIFIIALVAGGLAGYQTCAGC